MGSGKQLKLADAMLKMLETTFMPECVISL
jgi:hypothetical protein